MFSLYTECWAACVCVGYVLGWNNLKFSTWSIIKRNIFPGKTARKYLSLLVLWHTSDNGDVIISDETFRSQKPCKKTDEKYISWMLLLQVGWFAGGSSPLCLTTTSTPSSLFPRLRLGNTEVGSSSKAEHILRTGFFSPTLELVLHAALGLLFPLRHGLLEVPFPSVYEVQPLPSLLHRNRTENIHL